MTNVELALNTLAEVATTELSRQRNPKGMFESQQAAQAGGKVAKNAREDLERQLGRSVISSKRASDYLRPIENSPTQELPFDETKTNNQNRPSKRTNCIKNSKSASKVQIFLRI